MIQYNTIREQDVTCSSDMVRIHSIDYLYEYIKDHIDWYDSDFEFNTTMEVIFSINDHTPNLNIIPLYKINYKAIFDKHNAAHNGDLFTHDYDDYSNEEIFSRIPSLYADLEEESKKSFDNILKQRVISLFKNKRDMDIVLTALAHPYFTESAINSLIGEFEVGDSPFSIKFLNVLDNVTAFMNTTNGIMNKTSGFVLLTNSMLVKQEKSIIVDNFNNREHSMYFIYLAKMHAEKTNNFDDGIILLNALQIMQAFSKTGNRNIYA